MNLLFSKRRCPNCKTEYSRDADSCPECSYPASEVGLISHYPLVAGLAVVAAISIVVAVAWAISLWIVSEFREPNQ